MSEVYREQQFQVLCGLCREPAVARCIRCDRPLCDEHEPPADERCAACETEYRSREAAALALVTRDAQHDTGLSVPLAISLGVGAAIGLAFSLSVTAAAVAAIVAFGPVITLRSGYRMWFSHRRRARERRREDKRMTRTRDVERQEFLAERPRAKLLGAGSDPQPKAPSGP